MSAAPGEKVTDPHDLFERSDLPLEYFEKLIERLDPSRLHEFVQQVYVAAEKGAAEGDLRPINHVLESWFRTLVFMSDADLPDRVEAARSDTERFTLEDIQKRRTALR